MRPSSYSISSRGLSGLIIDDDELIAVVGGELVGSKLATAVVLDGELVAAVRVDRELVGAELFDSKLLDAGFVGAVVLDAELVATVRVGRRLMGEGVDFANCLLN